MTGLLARRDLRPYLLAAAALLAVKLICLLFMNPIGDEAYYWLWGQHPDWSYFDHPPLHAWLMLGIERLFGWNLISLRLLTVATFAGTLWIFWDWSRRLSPQDPAGWFWRVTALYLASPLFLGMSSIAFNDHLMIFLVLASGHAMLLFAEGVETDRPRWRWLYLSAVLLGLAVLSKYNAVFLGLAFTAFFLLRPGLRRLYRSPHTYLAALVSIGIQAPVLGWNLVHHFASYSFHVAGRWEGEPPHFDWLAPPFFLLVAAIVVSPVVLYGALRICFREAEPGFQSRASTLAVATFLVSSAAMLAMSSVVRVFFYWNIVAFMLMMPLLPLVLKRGWLVGLHLAYGLSMAALLVVNQFYAPIGNLTGSYDWTIASTYGWDEIGRGVEEARTEHGAGFVGTTFYTTAAQLGFAIKDPDVVALSSRPDQFDLWFDPEAHRGQSAILVADPYNPIDYAARFFGKVTRLGTIDVTSFGRVIYSPTLYLMEDFHPAADGASP